MIAKPGLSLAEHRRTSARLKVIRDELTDLSVVICCAYALGCVVGSVARTLVEPVDHLRSALDDAGFREHPEMFDTSFYYPGDRRLST